MKLSTKVGTFYTEVGGGIFPTSQKMLFCSRKSQVSTTAGETAEFEAQAKLPQLRLLALWFYFRVALSVNTKQCRTPQQLIIYCHLVRTDGLVVIVVLYFPTVLLLCLAGK